MLRMVHLISSYLSSFEHVHHVILLLSWRLFSSSTKTEMLVFFFFFGIR